MREVINMPDKSKEMVELVGMVEEQLNSYIVYWDEMNKQSDSEIAELLSTIAHKQLYETLNKIRKLRAYLKKRC